MQEALQNNIYQTEKTDKSSIGQRNTHNLCPIFILPNMGINDKINLYVRKSGDKDNHKGWKR